MSAGAVYDSVWWRAGCLSAALAVALGAFGAHKLASLVSDVKLLKTWDTAAHYHLLHSLALLLVPLCRHPERAGPLFVGTCRLATRARRRAQ